MGWVLLALVIAFFGVIEFGLIRDRVRLGPVRSAVRKEAVVYRTPISAQWGRGWAGRGNAQGIRLVVRENSFELSYPFPGGSLLTTEWYCWGKDARMKMGGGNFLPPRVKRDCIVLSIPSIDTANANQEILLFLRSALAAGPQCRVGCACGMRRASIRRSSLDGELTPGRQPLSQADLATLDHQLVRVTETTAHL